MPNIPKVKNFERIPTRFDDITKEIHQAKNQDYYKLQEVAKELPEKTYQLGSKIGEALKAINLIR